MNREHMSTIPFNTTTDALLDCQWKDSPLERISRIVIEGALFTGDKTTIEIDAETRIYYGTFNFDVQAEHIKKLKVTAGFGGARVGMLTVFYFGEDEKKLISKSVGTTAALPADLMKRL